MAERIKVSDAYDHFVGNPAGASAGGPSILFDESYDDAALPRAAPACFRDLNLDVVITAITSGKEEYELRPFFFLPLATVDAIAFRQAVMRELENPAATRVFRAFAKRMRAVRDAIAWMGKRHHRLQTQRWFVDLVLLYADIVTTLAEDFEGLPLAATGLMAMRRHIAAYTASAGFRALAEQARGIASDLSAIRYDVVIRGLQVEICPSTGEPDYGAQINSLFARFGDERTKDYAFEFSTYDDMNSIEARILERVAQTHVRQFSRLAEFCDANIEFLDGAILRFDRELQFYLGYLEHVEALRRLGQVFCYPTVSASDKTVSARDTFDIALAGTLAAEGKAPVPNDFCLDAGERILVVTGPNQGGKTTFARCFAQLHYLAALGCPVPGAQARLLIPDRIFTHFERAEHMTNRTGKLQDDLVRIHDILQKATPYSLVVINEIFASTTLSDAIALSGKIAENIARLDLLCVWVTFIDEIAALNAKTVSMVGLVDSGNPERRTFKIARQPPNSLAFALSLARKYGLTGPQILARMSA